MAVSLEALPTGPSDEALTAARRRRVLGYGTFAALAVVAVLVGREVPGWLDLDVQKWAQDRYAWAIVNRQTSPLFTWFFTPLGDFLAWAVEQTVWLLDLLRWPGVVVVAALIGWRTGGRNAALGGGLAMLGVGIISDWEHAMITLAIMVVAVVISLVLGVPLGILSARSDRF
ncbi:MAG: glycine betaine transport system permease protein OpuAB, partial [Actinomycetota bacterium]